MNKKLNFQFVHSKNVHENLKQEMFHLYVKTYSKEKKELWFKSEKDFFDYDCGFLIIKNQNFLNSFITFKINRNTNNILLVCYHDYNIIINLLTVLLRMNGWVYHASGLISHTLRKQNTPYIKDLFKIINYSDMLHNEDERILFNPNYNSEHEVHVHEYFKDGIIKYRHYITVFGTGGFFYNKSLWDRYYELEQDEEGKIIAKRPCS